MNNPNIIFTSPCVAEVLEKPMPEVQPGTALVRIVRTCISSGTERANLVGDPLIGTKSRTAPRRYSRASWVTARPA